LKVRRAIQDDLPFIRELTLETVDQGISVYRDIPNETVKAIACQRLGDLDTMLKRKRDYAILVATIEEQRAGFLILEFRDIEETTGEQQSLVYNLAVASDFLGKRVDRLLVAEAARVSHRRGYRFMTARITASNERALLAALKQGFEIERYQITMGCSAEGPQPLPGRSPEQRAHDLSRLYRQRKMRTNS
jgi:ribosomal protein S18 acetylase RimI-like enzyme